MRKDQKELVTEERRKTLSILIKLLPVIIVSIAILLLLPTIKAAMDRGQGVKFDIKGGSIEVFSLSLEQAQFEAGEKEDEVSPNAFAMSVAHLERRIRQDPDLIAGAAVLWVDDQNPSRNIYERKALRELGISIDPVKTTDEAISLLNRGVRYDALILDLDRPGQAEASCENGYANAGCDLLAKVQELCGDRLPAVVYAAGIDKNSRIPLHRTSMTNRVDNLVGYLLDAFSRRATDDASEADTGGVCLGNAIRN